MDKRRIPKKIDNYTLADLYREIEIELIKNMKKTLKPHKNWEKSQNKQWEQWQKTKLRALQEFKKENADLLNNYKIALHAVINENLKYTYEDVYEKEIAKAAKVLDYEVPEKHFFGINEKKVKTIIYEMQSTFETANGYVLRKTEDVYKQVINKSIIKLGLGTTTINRAIDDSTKEFLRKGLNCIVYKNGRKVNIASYAEMYLRTANKRATLLAEGAARADIGVYTVLMSTHANCSNLCIDYQGTVLIDDVFTNINKENAVALARKTGYTRLSIAMSNGVLHPNCRHSFTTFFPGISTMPNKQNPREKLEALQNYKLEQEQRRLENRLRSLKRLESGQLSENDIQNTKNKIKLTRLALKEHINNNPNLRRNYWRERAI